MKKKIKLKDVYSNNRNNPFWTYIHSIPEYKKYEKEIHKILKTK